MQRTPDIEGLDSLADWLSLEGAQRLLVLCTPGRRFLDQLSDKLSAFDVTVFDGAQVHVPREVVAAAGSALTEHGADTLISLGGGSATGLAKALRLEHEVRFAAIPTTYSASERTDIYGIREAQSKNTGRDERVRPDVIVRAPALLAQMPPKLTVVSLLNALAHPISALTALRSDMPAELRREAMRSIGQLTWALSQLLESNTSRAGRRAAVEGAALAGAVLDRAELGEHQRVAHRLGGRFGLEHAALHAVLLPHTVHRLAQTHPLLFEEISTAAGERDLPSTLYDALTRAGAARSLSRLGVEHDAFDALGLDPWITPAQLGRRPSIDTRTWDAADLSSSIRGPEARDAKRIVVALHGRGGNADRTLKDVMDWVGHDPSTTIIAPQATQNRWYLEGYYASRDKHGPALVEALSSVNALIDAVLARAPGVPVFLVGFSQGACLAAEIFLTRGSSLAGLVAIAGSRIDPAADALPAADTLTGLPAVLGIAAHDPWVNHDDVERTAASLEAAGAVVRRVCNGGEAHETTTRQRLAARELLLGGELPTGSSGFGNAHEGEALPGALPRHQNSPRKPPYGLFAEQVNGTGFGALRRENLRSWLYRIRPAARHRPLSPLSHLTFKSDWDDGGVEPNLSGWDPRPVPVEPTDFIDGIATFGGAGHPNLRRGYAVHLYVANRNMEHRAFYDADGDLLLVPQEGALTVQTEFGFAHVAPGQIAVLPRGMVFSVHLEGPMARGYLAEVYGRHFELPERGPVGSNGLTDPRHFRAPAAYFEDRLDPGYRLTTKLGNELFEATQDYSPYDVVAWHGDYTPYVYDLDDFCPVGTTRFDHADPSIFTVIGARLDEAGASSLDFVFFPPRWDPTEHTFRPPFFHRNAVTEFNGIIADPGLREGGPFSPGCYYLTPPMTAHGVLTQAIERATQSDNEAPVRISDRSKWFQLETILPMQLTSWARASANRVADWPSVWGAYRPSFDPANRE